MKTRTHLFFGAVAILLSTFSLRDASGAEGLKTMDYVTVKGGDAYLVTNRESLLLEHPLTLTSELKVLTNGVVKITGDGEVKLAEGSKVTLDGFWLEPDGMLVIFKPHYQMKDRTLFLVKDGVFTKVDQDINLPNGTVLRTDGSIATPDGRLIRLQDGQMLSLSGQPIPALDQVMMVDGRLVLQKDGSIIPLPVGSNIGMSDNSIVYGTGVVIRPGGEQIALQDGQRLTLPGAAMPKIQ
jgi:hypothetical protein